LLVGGKFLDLDDRLSLCLFIFARLKTMDKERSSLHLYPPVAMGQGLGSSVKKLYIDDTLLYYVN
jgi:hypothetical protein